MSLLFMSVLLLLELGYILQFLAEKGVRAIVWDSLDFLRDIFNARTIFFKITK